MSDAGCNICPHMCGIDRKTAVGRCGAGDRAEVAHVMLHAFEEPFISGTGGSGAIFFAHCALKCVYCQNYKISRGENEFKKYSAKELSDIFLSLQNRGAHNLNLVTPTHYTGEIIKAVAIAKSTGLNMPVVWNTSGYERAETIAMLDKTADVFLTDFKYFDDTLAQKYSGVGDYFAVADAALKQMVELVGTPKFTDGIMVKGVAVRHLVLPHHSRDSKKILEYLYKTFGNNIFVSIMNQFTVTGAIDAARFPLLCRTVTKSEYNAVVNFALDLGFKNALIQRGGTADESFIPDF